MRSRESEKRSRYLIDTSALYPMLLKGIVIDPNKFVISHLTIYEIGNVLWKETQQRRLSDPKRVARIFHEAVKDLQKMDIDSVSSVLLLAIERKLTFYDASYAYIAEKENLRLVTQDTDLREKTRNAVGVKDLE